VRVHDHWPVGQTFFVREARNRTHFELASGSSSSGLAVNEVAESGVNRTLAF